DPEAPGLTHQSRMRPRLSTRHRGIRAICLLRVLDRPASVVRLTRLSRSRPGTWLRLPRPRVPHPAPPNMTPHDSALSGRDDGNIYNIENKSRTISHVVHSTSTETNLGWTNRKSFAGSSRQSTQLHQGQGCRMLAGVRHHCTVAPDWKLQCVGGS